MIAAARAHPATTRSDGLRLAVWTLVSLGPMAAYAAPLWQNILADTPIAYLIWIPLLAVFWGGQELRRGDAPRGDAELDAILGVGLLLVTGATLVIGPAHWPYFFVMDSGGLLLWPLWLLGASWLLFGIGVTPRLLAPAVYLLLAWPPILSQVAALTQSVLVRLAIGAITGLSSFLPWLQTQGQGTFLVGHGASAVPVLVSNACSGADSALGAAILLPVLLARLSGAFWRKVILVVAAIAGAVLLNLLRLSAIIATIHYLGASFALGVVHPSLGFVLFAVLALALLAAAGWLGLRQLALGDFPPAAGTGRLWLALALGAGLFAVLAPLFSMHPGAPGNPLGVRSANPWGLMPRLSGFTAADRQHFNDVSILGPGGYSVAQTYVAPGGATVLAEVWLTPNLTTLESYGFRDCLLFHGEQIGATRTFAIAAGTPAVDYALSLPPGVVGGARQPYEDIEWESAVRLPGGSVRYLRYALASLPEPTGSWPASLRSAPGPQQLQGMAALAMPPAYGSWPRVLLTTQSNLRRFARAFVNATKGEDGAMAGAVRGRAPRAVPSPPLGQGAVWLHAGQARGHVRGGQPAPGAAS